MGEGAAPVTLKIFLIRHGESEWNRAHRYTGQRDAPLSELGREQARRLARRLVSEPLGAIYASPLRRAFETAHAIAESKSLPVTIDADLAEIHHGLWEGLTAREVEEKFPSEYGRWRAAPHTVVMPEGESLAEVARRAGASFERILTTSHGAPVAICSHDAVLRVLVLSALGLPLENFWAWRFENASLTVLESIFDQSQFRLTVMNETDHLENLVSSCDSQAL